MINQLNKQKSLTKTEQEQMEWDIAPRGYNSNIQNEQHQIQSINNNNLYLQQGLISTPKANNRNSAGQFYPNKQQQQSSNINNSSNNFYASNLSSASRRQHAFSSQDRPKFQRITPSHLINGQSDSDAVDIEPVPQGQIDDDDVVGHVNNEDDEISFSKKKNFNLNIEEPAKTGASFKKEYQKLAEEILSGKRTDTIAKLLQQGCEVKQSAQKKQTKSNKKQSFNHFLNKQNEFSKRKQSKIERMRKEEQVKKQKEEEIIRQEKQKLKNKMSIQLNNKRRGSQDIDSNVSIFDRLYQNDRQVRASLRSPDSNKKVTKNGGDDSRASTVLKEGNSITSQDTMQIKVKSLLPKPQKVNRGKSPDACEKLYQKGIMLNKKRDSIANCNKPIIPPIAPTSLSSNILYKKFNRSFGEIVPTEKERLKESEVLSILERMGFIDSQTDSDDKVAAVQSIFQYLPQDVVKKQQGVQMKEQEEEQEEHQEEEQEQQEEQHEEQQQEKQEEKDVQVNEDANVEPENQPFQQAKQNQDDNQEKVSEQEQQAQAVQDEIKQVKKEQKQEEQEAVVEEKPEQNIQTQKVEELTQKEDKLEIKVEQKEQAEQQVVQQEKKEEQQIEQDVFEQKQEISNQIQQNQQSNEKDAFDYQQIPVQTPENKVQIKEQNKEPNEQKQNQLKMPNESLESEEKKPKTTDENVQEEVQVMQIPPQQPAIMIEPVKQQQVQNQDEKPQDQPNNEENTPDEEPKEQFSAPVEHIKNLLLNILNLKKPENKSKTLKPVQKPNQNSKSIQLSQALIQKPQAIDDIHSQKPPKTQPTPHQKFLNLYFTYKKNENANLHKKSNAPAFLFQPSVNRRSQKLDSTHINQLSNNLEQEGVRKKTRSPSMSRFNLLMERGKMTKAKLDKLRDERKNDGMQQCIFKPKVNDYKTFKKRQQRLNKKTKEAILNLQQIKRGQLDEGERQPILFADVITKENEKNRIMIYEGDDPDEVTEKFAAEHNLASEKKAQLVLAVHDLLNKA